MRAEDLKQFRLLVEFDEQDRRQLCDFLEPLALAEGEMLFREGEEADSLYLVARGSVRIGSAACGDLGWLCEGSHLGAVSLISIGSREASARGESDCDFLVLERSGFRRLAEDYPRTACRLAEAVAAELAATLRPQLSHIKRVSFRPATSSSAVDPERSPP